MVSPGLDPGFHQSEGGNGTTALIQLNDIVYLPYIKISYFFTNVLMTRITSLHWIRTRTPTLGIQGDIHYTTHAEGYYISLHIYFWTSQRQEGTCQLHRFKPHCVHYCKHHPGHRTALLNCHHLLGVANQQICKLQTASSDLSIYAQESLIGLSYL